MVNVFTMGNTCSTSHGLSNNKSYFNEESNCPYYGFSTYFGTHLIKGEKLELKGSCFYNLKPWLHLGKGECCFNATVKNVERITRKSHDALMLQSI